MKRWIPVMVLALMASFAPANGEFLDAFVSHYKVKDDSPMGEKSCGICHISDSDFAFNAYGKEVKKAMTDKAVSAVSGAFLASLDALDADGDGTPNGNEIAAGTFPGDPASGAAPGAKPVATAEPEKKPASFPPKNAYHPAIVHFPIALFIGGLVLDFLGMLRKDKTLLHAGWYCIVMAAITSIGAILSGVGAMMLLKLPYKGLIFTHLAMGVVASVLMGVMVAMRVHRHEKMNVPMRVVYYLLALACFGLISWAGHLGGVFVYGE